MTQKIIEQNIIESMRKEMGIYSYNINLFRAIPDVRDGLIQIAPISSNTYRKLF